MHLSFKLWINWKQSPFDNFFKDACNYLIIRPMLISRMTYYSWSLRCETFGHLLFTLCLQYAVWPVPEGIAVLSCLLHQWARRHQWHHRVSASSNQFRIFAHLLLSLSCWAVLLVWQTRLRYCLISILMCTPIMEDKYVKECCHCVQHCNHSWAQPLQTDVNQVLCTTPTWWKWHCHCAGEIQLW